MLKTLTTACILWTLSWSGEAHAQRLSYVESAVLPDSGSTFTAGESVPTSIRVLDRSNSTPPNPPARYSDFSAWSPWLSAATDILYQASLSTVDITSLTFPDNGQANTSYQRRALLRAIAYNLLDRRLSPSLALLRGAQPLRVRMLFGQLMFSSSIWNSGFAGHVCDALPYPGAPAVCTPQSPAGQLGSEFLEQFRIAYAAKYNQQPSGAWASALGRAVTFALVDGYWGKAFLLASPVSFFSATDNAFNHSKIISNGMTALVGGTNMYTAYLIPMYPDGGVVQDADLVMDGAPAVFASRWMDTLFVDYRTVNSPYNSTSTRDLGVITFRTRAPSETGEYTNPCECARNPGTPYCTNNQLEGQRIVYPSDPNSMGCYYGGWLPGRVDTSWLGFGASLTPVNGTGGPTVLSIGEHSNVFSGNNVPALGYSLGLLADYDRAIGSLIWSADQNPGTKIMISQQDVLNRDGSPESKGADLEGPVSQGNTAQRWWLAERIAYELMKGPPAKGREDLSVFIIKSNGGGKDYDTYSLENTIDVLWNNVWKRYEYQWDHAASYGFPPKSRPFSAWQKWHQTGTVDRFCEIVQAKNFRDGQGRPTPLHNKFVMVYSPAASLSAVSIGSLNFYNYLVMHDYGNIVFDNHAAGSVNQVLHDRFKSDWANSVYAISGHQNPYIQSHCKWQEEGFAESSLPRAQP